MLAAFTYFPILQIGKQRPASVKILFILSSFPAWAVLHNPTGPHVSVTQVKVQRHAETRIHSRTSYKTDKEVLDRWACCELWCLFGPFFHSSTFYLCHVKWQHKRWMPAQSNQSPLERSWMWLAEEREGKECSVGRALPLSVCGHTAYKHINTHSSLLFHLNKFT